MFTFNHRKSRPVTCKLLDGVEQGVYDKDNMIRDLLNWLSEDDVAQFARKNEYLPDEDESTDEEETEA